MVDKLFKSPLAQAESYQNPQNFSDHRTRIQNKENAKDKVTNDTFSKYKSMGYDDVTAQMKTNIDVNYGGDFLKNYDDVESKDFDEYGLITENGRNKLHAFFKEKDLTPGKVDKLSNDEFNALAKEVQQKYGIDDFELAQEFLVSEHEFK